MLTNKPKTLIFIAIVLVLSAILLFRFLIAPSASSGIMERTIEANTAVAKTLKSPGAYEIGKDGFAPGYYDIKIVKGSYISSGSTFTLSADQRVLGYQLFSGEKLSFQGEGEVSFSPALFESMGSSDSHFSLHNVSGEFKVGDEIYPGNYIVTLSTSFKSQTLLLVQTSNRDHSKVFDSLSFNDSNKNGHITLKEGDYLQVTPFSALDDFIITFEKDK